MINCIIGSIIGTLIGLGGSIWYASFIVNKKLKEVDKLIEKMNTFNITIKDEK